MSDDREFWDDQQTNDLPGADDVTGDDASVDDEFPLLSADDFDEELEALAEYAPEDELDDAESDALEEDVDLEGDEDGEILDSDDEDDSDPVDDLDDDGADDEVADVDEDDLAAEDSEERDAFVDDDVLVAAAIVVDAAADQYAAVDRESEDDYADDSTAVDEEDRLRQPRAGRFRRTVRNQLGMLPLALLLIVLGGFLLARGQDVSGLPDLEDDVLAAISVVTVGFAAVFHSLLSGRRERGLLFVGLWVLCTSGLIAALVFLIDDDPDIGKWWPLLLWSTSLTLMFTYLIERAHDVRLIFLGVVAFVAGVAAYLVSGDVIDDNLIEDIADYWPLLLTILGIGLLPLVFQRRTE